jgi:radical SAM protein with 4Fe4S-binding SPASM domain
MRLPYARTLARLQMIHRKKAAGEFAPRVVLSRVGDGSAVDQEFCRWVGEHFPGFQSSVFPRGSWLGQVAVSTGPVPRVGCTRWFELSITATGVVAHCCMDGKAAYPIGDVSKQHVLEVYNEPHYRALRERTTTRLQVEPCNRCTFL